MQVEFSEQFRLRSLHSSNIMDEKLDEHFDSVVRHVVNILDFPVALVTLVDSEIQWIKSRIGTDVRMVKRCYSFCDHTIRGDGIMEITDMTRDRRFLSNPLVTGAPYIRYYAGAPLILGSGARIGAVCVLDTVPHSRLGYDARCFLKRQADRIIRLTEMKATPALH